MIWIRLIVSIICLSYLSTDKLFRNPLCWIKIERFLIFEIVIRNIKRRIMSIQIASFGHLDHEIARVNAALDRKKSFIRKVPVRVWYHAKFWRNEKRISTRPGPGSGNARTLVRSGAETSAGQPRRRPQAVRRVRPPAGVRAVGVLPAPEAVVVDRAEPVNAAEAARVAADLPGRRGHAGEAVGQAAVDVALLADGRDGLAVVDVRQIGLSVQVRWVEKRVAATRTPRQLRRTRLVGD